MESRMKKRVRTLPSTFFHLYLILWLQAGYLGAEDSSEWLTQANHKSRSASISQDGKILAYVHPRGKKSELWIKYLQDSGSGVKVFSVEGKIESPRWRRDHRAIVYSLKNDKKSKIYLKNLGDRSKPRLLTTGDANYYHPALSPDGKWLAFDSDLSGNYDIWLQNLKNSELTRVTTFKNHDFYPDFSPDGTHLVYTSFRNNTFNLFMKKLSVNGSLPLQLTQGEHISAHPRFSPSGSGIYFDSNRTGKNQIYFFSLKDYAVFSVTSGRFNASFPSIAKKSESEKILVFDCQEQGVTGIKTIKLGADVREQFTRLEPVKEFSEIKHELELSLEAAHATATGNPPNSSFETDLKRIKVGKEELVRNPKLPSTGFENESFDLGFLNDSPTQGGILVGGEGLNSDKALNEKTIPPSIRPILARTRDSALTQLSRLKRFKPLHTSTQAKKIASPLRIHRPDRKTKLRSYFEPKMPPFVLGTYPSQNERDVKPYQPIGIIFKRKLSQEEKQRFLRGKIFVEDQEVPVETRYSGSLMRLDFIPKEALKGSTKYRVSAGGTHFSFTTWANPKTAKITQNSPPPKVPKQQALAIDKGFPNHRSRNVKVTTPIQVRFNAKLNPDSINASSLELFENGVLVPGELTFENNDQVLTLQPYRNLREATVYDIKVGGGLEGRQTQRLQRETEWKFKTEHFSPFLISKSPHSIMDNPVQPLILEFNRPLKPSSLRPDEFFLQGKSFRYQGGLEIKEKGKILVFTPYQRVPDQQDLRFYLSPNLRDTDGNILQNTGALPIATRFPRGFGSSGRVIAKARKLLPRVKQSPKNPQTSVQTLEGFFKRGYIKNKEARNIASRSATINRYRIALLIEESLSSFDRMTRKEKNQLETLLLEFSDELKNMGINVDEYQQRISLGLRPGVLQNSRRARDFISRGRRL
jgi:hypothetical protein